MSVRSRFMGKGLDAYAEDYTNLTRRENEADWEFRKRIFVETYFDDPLAAIEYLVASRHDEFDDNEKLIVAMTMSCGSKEDLQRIADGYAVDPAISRTQN